MARRAEPIEIDLADAGRSRRWRIELELRSGGFQFHWVGDRLHIDAAALQRLEHSGVLDMDGPDDDLVDHHHDEPSTWTAPPVRLVATDAWWKVANPLGTLATARGVIVLTVVLVGAVVWALNHLFG